MPSGCNVCHSWIQNFLFFSLIHFPTWIVVHDIHFGFTKVIQWVHGQECLFRKVTSVFIHSFVEWLDTFCYVLQPTDVTVKEVNNIRCFAICIAKYVILLSCRLTMKRLCVLQLLSFSFWNVVYAYSSHCVLGGINWTFRFHSIPFKLCISFLRKFGVF